MMLKLYFGNVPTIISTFLIVGFIVFLSMVIAKRSSINHWGVLALCMFILGLLLSIFSGTKDGVGTPNALFALNSWAMILLSALGALAFLLGIVMLFVRKQEFWQFGFYALSADIIIKTILVETIRILAFYKIP